MSFFVPWEAHVEVWILLAGVCGIAWFVVRVLEPKASALGYEPTAQRQKYWYVLAGLSMWIISDWPIHEVAEQHLYFVHMVQHLFLSMFIPALFVCSVPRWLFELFFDSEKSVWRGVRTLSKPLVAAGIFNVLTVLLHLQFVVQLSADNGAFHFLVHLLVFAAGLVMWMPVIGPVEEWRLAPLGKCIYLFGMSIVPTVPGGWLVFAEGVVYPHYDTAERLWGIDVLSDQQAAGVVMKLVGGFFLWVVILVIFSRWAMKESAKDRGKVLHNGSDRITFNKDV